MSTEAETTIEGNQKTAVSHKLRHHSREFVSIRNLRKIYAVDDDKVVALGRVNLKIPRGQICCIFGESGSGKSTLLNLMAGMEQPTRGSVRIVNGTVHNSACDNNGICVAVRIPALDAIKNQE